MSIPLKVKFGVLQDHGDKGPWRVIYSRSSGAQWDVYQSAVCDFDTAITIARALEAAGVDPERP